MNRDDFSRQFTHLIDELSDCTEMEKQGFFHEYQEGDSMPSAKALEEIMDICRSIFFPGFYGKPRINHTTLKYTIGVEVERLHELLVAQVTAGFNMAGKQRGADACSNERVEDLCQLFLAKLKDIREVLATDVVAAYNGDPAAESYAEIISCYPVMKALTNYRVAHELYLLGVPFIPRILTEMAHSQTGIDIHPGAKIGSYFTIDHGTGVVVGSTCIIGNHVKLYQGVTLGAKSFPLDENGNPIKGIPRHPIIEDDVIIYSNATILGRITIGKGATIGGNLWVTEDVPPGGRVLQHKSTHEA